EVEPLGGEVSGHLDLRRRGRCAAAPGHAAGDQNGQRPLQQASSWHARVVHRALYSSFSDTVFHSSPLTSVTSATGWPSLRAGMTLTTRYPLFSFTASEATASSARLAFAIASLCAFAAVRSSLLVRGSTFATLPDVESTITSE